jgi:hypothetical protein
MLLRWMGHIGFVGWEQSAVELCSIPHPAASRRGWGTRCVVERLKYLVWFIRVVVGFAGADAV